MNRRDFLKLLQASVLLFSPVKAALAASQKQGTGFVYDDLFLEYWLEKGHPESPDRLRSIMKTMEQSLVTLVRQGIISTEVAQEYTTRPDEILALLSKS